MSEAPAAARAQPDGRQMARLLVLAIALGVLAAVGASAFLLVVEEGQALLFEHVPDALGWDGPTWWYAGLVLLVGAGLVAVAQGLPGGTGRGPLTGFHFDTPLPVVPSVLLAALGTLAFGFALGPEAPLIVLGTAVGAIATRRAGPDARRVAMLLGGVAAIGAVFGNPFITGFMVLEFAAFGLMPAVVLVPVLVALGSGYLVQVGIWRLPGLGVHPLAVPGLPAYDHVQALDLLLGLVVAILAAILAIAIRELAVGFERVALRRRRAALVATAAVTTAAVAIAVEGVGAPLDEVLFSGSGGMGALIGETSLATVLVVLLAKGAAYGAALGGGLRGGPIFPATFLGVGVGVAAALVFGGATISPLAAVGIAATAAAFTRLPATSALLAALLIAGGGAAIAPFAILGAVVGFLARSAADARLSAAR